MMKKKNKGKKALTAVGVVVAAGLTPGIITATPACIPGQNPNALITAAEVVSIDGNAYSFDELYAMQQGASRDADPQVATRYGVIPSQQVRMYGVKRPQHPQQLQQPPQPKQPTILLDTIQSSLVMYCAQLLEDEGRFTPFSLDSDLTRKIGLTEEQLKLLAEEITRRYGVEVSYRRFYLNGQLNTLRLVSEYIFKLKTVWD